ncbi:MAG: peptide/nickel transport system ATP-binding protein [Flavobacteriales bacterium]|jgi:peptide/nickel transport system ATP-binding protein
MNTETESILLDVQDLTISFRSGNEWVNAVEKVSFQVKTGKVLGIVGESGSGKTVSSLACMGLLPDAISRINNGKALFKGRDLIMNDFALAKELRGREMAMVFQEPMTSLNPSMRCGAQVAEVILAHAHQSTEKAKQKVIDLFEEVELPSPKEIWRRYPHELSGGQKQRVVIALALAAEPALLIADEPTTALDVTVQKSILTLLAKLQKERGLSMIFISHDLDLVAQVSDEISVMYKGHVVEMGNAKKVLEKPSHQYTKGLLACKPPVNGERIQLATLASVLQSKPKEIKHYTSEIDSAFPLLEIRDLVKHFPIKKNLFGKTTAVFEAVKGVSFNVFKGETLGIVGESGCGKSTVSRIIMGLIESTSGSIEWKKGASRSIQLVFQDPYSSLNPRLTAGQSISEALLVSKTCSSKEEAQNKTNELLTEVGLEKEHFSRYPHSFSGGQRQRLVIARALATSPDVLILDESVSALDVSVQAQVLNLLNELKAARNLTFLFISHDLHVVRFMSDRLLIMEAGSIVESGNAHAIFTNAQHPYTQKLLASIPETIPPID